jgi:hypothetical protein
MPGSGHGYLVEMHVGSWVLHLTNLVFRAAAAILTLIAIAVYAIVVRHEWY